MYLGALIVINNESNPERYHQAAHSLRELTYYLTNKIEIPSEELEERKAILNSIYSRIKNSSEFDKESIKILKNVIDNLKPEKPTHTIKIKTLIESIDELGGIPKETIIKQWYDLHNYFVMLCHHHTNKAKLEDFDNNLMKLEYILLALLCPVYESIDELDKIMIKDAPSQNDIEKVKSLLKFTSQTNYFFLRLDKPGWLLPLAENGFFDKPPMKGGYSVEPVYIRKVADKIPDKSVEVIKKLSQTNHLGAQVEFMKAINKISTEYSISLINCIQIWINSIDGYTSALHNQVIIYIKKLFNDGLKEEGFILSKSLFALKQKTNNGSEENHTHKILRDNEAYFYKAIVNELLSFLCDSKPIETISFFCKVFKWLIENPDDLLFKSKDKDDLSLYWRKSIRSDNRYFEEKDIRNVVVSTIRDAIDYILSKNPDQIENILSIVKNFEYSIFRRLELYIYFSYPSLAKSDIKKFSLKKDEFDEINKNLELNTFLKENFHLINLTEKEKYKEWVKSGPDTTEFTNGYQQVHHSYPSEEIIELYKKKWNKEKLIPIIDFLRDEELENFGLKKDDFKIDDEEKFDGPRFFPISPKTITELVDIEKGELVDLIVECNSNNDDFMSPKEGLGRNIQKIILKNPKKYIPYLKELKENPKTHYIISDFINGFNSALEYLEKIDIIPIIEICEIFIIENTKLEVSSSFFDPNPFRNFKIRVVWFIENLIREDKINLENSERILNLILNLLEDIEPEHNYEMDQKLDNLLLKSLMGNTIKGAAMSCFFTFVRWYITKKKQIENVKIESLGDLFPSISETLEKYLNLNIEQPFTIRYIYGIHLNDLILIDPKWFKLNHKRILPDPKKFLGYWDATLAGYLDFSHISSLSYDILKPEFKKIIELSYIEPQNLNFISISKFIENLMLLYVEGKETLENDDSLVKTFFDVGDDDSRMIAMRYLGTKLSYLNKRDDIDIVMPRLENLISKRIENIKQGNAEDYKYEISSLIYWYRESIFDDGFTINILKEYVELSQGKISVFYDVIDKAGNMMDKYPEIVLNSIEIIIKNELNNNQYIIYPEKFRNIFIKGINNQNNTIKQKTKDIINFIGQKGFHEFRDLL